MHDIQITGKVTNSDGASEPISGTLHVIDPPVISSVDFTPNPAVAGQTVTVTINATDPQNLPLTYAPDLNGTPLTAPDPTKPNVFSFVAI